MFENINLHTYAGQKAYKSCQTNPNTVLIADIRGSEGRAEDLDSQFNLLSERRRDRWLNIAIARSQYCALPPVELIQIGSFYFVSDGHHRISVARALGEDSVDADVTVLHIDGPLPWEQSFKDGQVTARGGKNHLWKAGNGYDAPSISG